jgi:hypothetical protein
MSQDIVADTAIEKDPLVDEQADLPKDVLIDDDAPEEEKPAPPEDFELTAPEGVEVDEVTLKEVKDFAKELGITKEQAEKLLAKNLELNQRHHEASKLSLDNAAKDWIASAKSDKEIGGDQFSQTIKDGKNVLMKYGTEEFKAILKASKLSQHPEVLRFLSRIGKDLGNDSFVGLESGAQVQKELSIAERLYPSLAKK